MRAAIGHIQEKAQSHSLACFPSFQPLPLGNCVSLFTCGDCCFVLCCQTEKHVYMQRGRTFSRGAARACPGRAVALQANHQVQLAPCDAWAALASAGAGRRRRGRAGAWAAGPRAAGRRGPAGPGCAASRGGGALAPCHHVRRPALQAAPLLSCRGGVFFKEVLEEPKDQASPVVARARVYITQRVQ